MIFQTFDSLKKGFATIDTRLRGTLKATETVTKFHPQYFIVDEFNDIFLFFYYTLFEDVIADLIS